MSREAAGCEPMTIGLKGFVATVLFTVLAVLPPRADAALMCSGTICTDTLALSLGGSTDLGAAPSTVFNLAQFDPSLGTLNSARLLIDATKTTGLNLSAYNPDDGEGPQNVIAQVSTVFGSPYFFFHFPTAGPFQIHHILVPVLITGCNLDADDGCIQNTSDVLAIDEFVGIIDPSPMIGTGEFGVSAGVANLATFCEWTAFPPFNPDRTCQADMGSTLFGTLTVEYLFTPAVTEVPSPATLPLLAAGLAALGLARRRS